MYSSRYIEYLKEDGRTLFAECCEAHNEGTLFPFEKITEEQLRQLFIDERVTDLMLAELFGVDQKAVMKKRNEFKIYRLM